jgi:hypothetical protein
LILAIEGLLRLWISRKRRKEEILLVNASVASAVQSLFSPSCALEQTDK